MAFMSVSMFVFHFILLHTDLDAISYVAVMWGYSMYSGPGVA